MFHMDVCITLVHTAIVGGALWAVAKLVKRGVARLCAAPVEGGGK